MTFVGEEDDTQDISMMLGISMMWILTIFVPNIFFCIHIFGQYGVAFQASRTITHQHHRHHAKYLPAALESARLQPLYSASLEEGEDLLLHYGRTDKTDSPRSRPPVRRVYETWQWTCATAAGRNETFNINYRVEKPPAADKVGPPVLLVHGFGANINHFRHQYAALTEAGYTVYAIDLLGFGASDKPLTASTTGFSIELFVRQLTDFVAAMAPRHPGQAWTLAGNSIGGLSCLGVAAAWEEQQRQQLQNQGQDRKSFDLASVVLFNSAGGMTGFRYEYVPWWARPIMGFFQYVVLGRAIGGFFFQNFRSPENIERILQTSGVYADTTNVDDELLEILLAPADDPGACEVFLAVFGGPPGPTPESFLQQIDNLPVLALWGEADPWTPLDAGMNPGTGFAKYCRTLRLQVLPGTGHCPHDEAPQLVNPQLIAFLNEIYSGQSQQQQQQRISSTSSNTNQ